MEPNYINYKASGEAVKKAWFAWKKTQNPDRICSVVDFVAGFNAAMASTTPAEPVHESLHIKRLSSATYSVFGKATGNQYPIFGIGPLSQIENNLKLAGFEVTKSGVWK